MRRNLFGDPVITSTDDDLIDADMEIGMEELHGMVEQDEATGKWSFTLKENESGEDQCFSDPIFDTKDAAITWLKGWVNDVQVQE